MREFTPEEMSILIDLVYGKHPMVDYKGEPQKPLNPFTVEHCGREFYIAPADYDIVKTKEWGAVLAIGSSFSNVEEFHGDFDQFERDMVLLKMVDA